MVKVTAISKSAREIARRRRARNRIRVIFGQLSLREVGRRTGIDSTNLSKMLRGSRGLRLDIAVEIARTLKISVGELIARLKRARAA